MHNFLPVILVPTRLTVKSVTLLDHIYYYEGTNSKKEFLLQSGNIFADLSDHLPAFLLLTSLKKISCYSHRPLIRLHTPKNRKLFSEILQKVDWNDIIYTTNDVNIGYNALLAVLKQIYETSFPLTRQSRKACHDKKWITPCLKKSCIKKIDFIKNGF